MAKQKKKRILIYCLLGAAVVIAFLLSPVFAMKKVVLSPLTCYEEEEIYAKIRPYLGKNGFLSVAANTTLKQSASLLSLELPELAEELVFSFPYLKDVKVKYAFPNTLRIDVSERIPIFLAEQHGFYLYIDSEGVVLNTFTEADKPALPVVQGLEITDYKIGNALTKTQNDGIDLAIRLCNLMRQLSMLADIDIIDLSDYNNIGMYCAPSLSVKFGDGDDLGVRLSQLKSIMQSGYDGDSDGVLDFTGGGYPVFTKNERNDRE